MKKLFLGLNLILMSQNIFLFKEDILCLLIKWMMLLQQKQIIYMEIIKKNFDKKKVK